MKHITQSNVLIIRLISTSIFLVIALFVVKVHGTYKGNYAREFSYTPERLLDEGMRYLNESKADSALFCFSLLQNKTHDWENEKTKCLYLTSLDGAGVALFISGRYAESHEMFQKALQVDSAHVNSHMNMAGIYLLFDDLDRTVSHLKAAYRKYMNAGQYDEMAVALINLINIGILYDRIEESRDVINQFLKFDFEDKTPALQFSRHVALGARNYQDHNYIVAINKFKDALSQTDFSFLNGRMEVDIYGNLAKIWDKNGNCDSALYYINKAYDISQLLGNPDQIVWIENTCSDILERSGRHDDAIRHRYKALSISDSIKTYSQFREITGAENRMIVDEFVVATEKLKAEKRERNIVITCLCVVIVLFVGFLIILFRKNKQLRQKNEVIFATMSKGVKDGNFINDEEVMTTQSDYLNEFESSEDSMPPKAPLSEIKIENLDGLKELAVKIDSRSLK